MISPFDLWNRFCSENNTFQGGFWRPDRDFERNMNTVSLELWNEYTAQAEKSQEIMDELSVFLKSVNIIVQQTMYNYGLAKYPPNYDRYSSAGILLHKENIIIDTSKDIIDCDGKVEYDSRKETPEQKQKRIDLYKDGIIQNNIYKVDNSRWRSLLTHKNKYPTFENPAMTQSDEGFKVAPRQVPVIVLDYWKKPAYAKFVYTLSPADPVTGQGDNLIYDPNKSTNLEWRESMIPEFLKRLTIIYSKYTRDGGLFQMGKAS